MVSNKQTSCDCSEEARSTKSCPAYTFSGIYLSGLRRACALLYGGQTPVNLIDKGQRPPRVGAENPTPEICVSPAMVEVLQLARRAAGGDSKVLITGESGVGKDLIARSLHTESPRSRGPFVAVNCAGLTETLLESELFGHVKGSFTGAYRDKVGKLQAADRGTLFLDEVGEMSLRMQAMLLRFLEQGELQRVGSDERTRRVDVRIVAATNRNLAERVASGDFREDLLYRLRVIHIHVPPLRDRRTDIRPLVAHFARRRGLTAKFTPAALDLLERYRWPGNVRELQNIVEHAIWQSDGREIGPEFLPQCVRVTEPLLQTQERRRQIADELYDALINGGCSFWSHIHPLFLARDITRHDIRELVRRGLRATRGSYRGLLTLFGMNAEEYQRFHNFLAAHDCKVDYREFRTAEAEREPKRRRLLPELAGRGQDDPALNVPVA
jgi:DNA-binding NtrC family response regulator